MQEQSWTGLQTILLYAVHQLNDSTLGPNFQIGRQFSLVCPNTTCANQASQASATDGGVVTGCANEAYFLHAEAGTTRSTLYESVVDPI